MCHSNPYKSRGLDDIPARFVKDAATVLTKPITYIVNLSITSGVVPDQLKSEQAKPLCKKKEKRKKNDNRTDVGNYRPVTLLFIISTILEKAVYKHLGSCFIKNNLLYEFQSCFRSAYYIDHSLIIYNPNHLKACTQA